ncbi:hypothetical protein B0H14DRAFT_2887240 [Mycena olivaceomarginata]|nr:hypothetical protein B0H14DRAFT_2887240 [Mycena olivaceomarginata]
MSRRMEQDRRRVAGTLSPLLRLCPHISSFLYAPVLAPTLETSRAQYTSPRLDTSRAFAVPANRRLRLRRSTPTCSLQYSSAAVQFRVRARYQLRVPTSRLRARRARVPPARSRPSPILFASSPLLRFLALDILDTFPISGLTSPFPPRLIPSHCSLPTHCATGSIHQCRLALSALARAARADSRAACSAVPDLPVRHPARAVGSAHGFAVHQAHTSPPILPSSSTLFPSHLKTRPVLLASGRLRRLATSENGHL